MATVSPNAPASDPGLIFYDIAFTKPYEKTSSAPNPWKARYALNLKSAPYTTTWVQMPNITTLRRSLNVPPCRNFADGTEFHTLPMLRDPGTGTVIGDSFDIAIYLQRTFPEGDDLFLEQDLSFECSGPLLIPLSERNYADKVHAEYARFNNAVDNAFTLHVPLMAHGMRFDPEVEEEVRAEFERFGDVK
ncbi:hypothetical protein N0V88_006316 [Collariella sp. IMI 366227]|nr:hypothetical protein N0V88_006316 [Collariella sp. IMI 366227]